MSEEVLQIIKCFGELLQSIVTYKLSIPNSRRLRKVLQSEVGDFQCLVMGFDRLHVVDAFEPQFFMGDVQGKTVRLELFGTFSFTHFFLGSGQE